MWMLMVTKLLVFFCLVAVTNSQVERNSVFDPDAIVDPKIVQEKWSLMESLMESSVKDVMKMLLPKAMEASYNLNISSSCTGDIFKLMSGLKKMKIWAFKFLDASSVAVNGMLDMSFASLGNYDECINNEVIDERPGKHKGEIKFRGKYCRIHVRPYLPPKSKRIRFHDTLDVLKKFAVKDTVIGYVARMAHMSYYGSFSTALCVPSGCSKDDINQVLRKVSDYIGVVVKTGRCEIKEDTKFTPQMIFVICLCCFIGFMVLIGSIVDIYGRYDKKTFKSVGVRILASFSFISSFLKFKDTSEFSGVFSCINGMKTITMFWIILLHSYFFASAATHKASGMFETMGELSYQVIQNATLSVDTYFFITGTLISYGFTKSVVIGMKPFNVFRHVYHRIWRIFPVYAFVIIFYFLLPAIGSGPLYNALVEHGVKSCEKNWWASMIFISNLYDVHNICVGQGWYLSVDMQLHIGVIIIFLTLMKSPKLGIIMAIVTIIVSMAGSWLSIYLNELALTTGFSGDLMLTFDTLGYYYFKPHVHSGPYCIGTLSGYLLATRPKLKIPKALQIAGWCVSTVVCLLVVYGPRKWYAGAEETFLETLFYSSCYRTAWGLSMAWVVICCSTGHGGIANYILSWKIWTPLTRLAFSVYLINPVIVIIYNITTRGEVFFDHRTNVYAFLGHLVLSYLLAFGVYTMIEAPFSSLEGILFPKERKQGTSCNKDNDEQCSHQNGSLEKNGVILVIDEKKDIQSDDGVYNNAFVQKPPQATRF